MTPPKKKSGDSFQQILANGLVGWAMKNPFWAGVVAIALYSSSIIIPHLQSAHNQDSEIEKLNQIHQHGILIDSAVSMMTEMKPKVDGLYLRQNKIVALIDSTPTGTRMRREYAQLQEKNGGGI